MVIIFMMLLFWTQDSYTAPRQLSARECKEQIGSSAASLTQVVADCLVRLGKEHKQLSGDVVVALGTVLQECITLIDGLMDDHSFWHRATRSTLVKEVKDLTTALDTAAQLCKKETSVENIKSACDACVKDVRCICERIRLTTTHPSIKRS